MTVKDVNLFFAELQGFFKKYFPEFLLHETKKAGFNHYAYFCTYDAYKLSILITVPISLDTDGEKVHTKENIGIALKDIGIPKRPYRIELRDVRIACGWQNRLYERIEVLQDLIGILTTCKKCGQHLLPRVHKRRDNGTEFVALYCEKEYCNTYKTTPYGTTLKTRLHKNLKKM